MAHHTGPVPNYYDILGVPRGETLEAVKRAAYNKRKKWTRQASSAPAVELRREAEDNLSKMGGFDGHFESAATREKYDRLLEETAAAAKRDATARAPYAHAPESDRETLSRNRETEKQNSEADFARRYDVMLDQAWKLFMNGRKQEASVIAHKIRFFIPSDRRLLEIILDSYITEGGYEAALLTATDAIKLYPHDPAFRFLLGKVFAIKEEWQRSWEETEKAWTIDRRNREYAMQLGIAGHHLGYHDSVIRILEPFVPDSRGTVLLHNLGIAYLQKAVGEKVMVPKGYGLPPGTYYTGLSQIQNAKKYVSLAEKLNVSSLDESIADVRRSIDSSEKRYFAGNRPAEVIMGLLAMGAIALRFAPAASRQVTAVLKSILNVLWKDGIALIPSSPGDLLAAYCVFVLILYHLSERKPMYVICSELLKGTSNLLRRRGNLPEIVLTVVFMPLAALGALVKNFVLVRVT